MSTASNIEKKLSAFISKYYKNQLLRGAIFFFAIGVTYFLVVLLIEYFFWLRPVARTFLFWSFVGIEVLLLYRFVLVPLARLFKLQKGIDFKYASAMIGEHFPEVSDKLINTLQLKSKENLDELTLASIEQRSRELEPVPFSLAIDYRKNARFLKFAGIPIVLFMIINFFYGAPVFKSSYTRMVNYNTAYEPPAPFEFMLASDNLEAVENKDYEVQVKVTGKVMPENVQILINGTGYYMKNEGNGSFSYIVERPGADVGFSFRANEVRSKNYTLKIIKAPVITDFEMALDYPSYTGRKDEVIKNTGSLSIPEGTKVEWRLKTEATNKISWISKDTTVNFEAIGSNSFSYGQSFTRSTGYAIATSNKALLDYERMDYSLDVIRDAMPKIEVESRLDTVSGLQVYHQGTISDDYGFSVLRLVYYPESDPKSIKRRSLSINGSRMSQFVAAFPDTLELQLGTTYAYYFEVLDNDAVNRYKSARSEVFSYNKLTDEALAEQQLDQQRESIDNLDRSIKKIDAQEIELEQLSTAQKEKQELSFSEQQQLKNVLNQQKEQGKNLQQDADKLRKNLEDFSKKNPDESKYNEELQQRLKQNEERLKAQEDLLDELNKLRDKISKEDLNERLEKLAKQNSNSKKSLKQLLELTKRYYVEQKMKRIASAIEELSRKQEKLANEEVEKEQEKQKELGDDFKKAEKALKDLKKENEQLKKPMELPEDIPLQEAIKKDQEKAEEELEKEDAEEEQEDDKSDDGEKQKKAIQKSAQKKQQSASEKMKQLARQMQSQMAQSGGETLKEDVAMLRQILDNLLLFSFKEEDLMKEFRVMDNNNPVYSKKLVEQQTLKQTFEHVDDSLFALSLRVPQLGEAINKELTDIDYSLNQALERLAQNEVSQGTASQQYVLTGANTLADMLSEILNNMQEQLSGSASGAGKGAPMPGQGQGSGDQLSDIIISQKELAKKMGQGSSGEGEKGKQGEAGKEGKDGKNGEEGEGGENGNKGKDGKDGEGNGGSEGSGGGSGQGNTNAGLSEQQKLEQYEIYKQQQKIRQELEDLIQEQGLGEDANSLVKDMEEMENKLLDGTFNEGDRNKMANIMHELLKVKNAQQEQGMENKRESNTSKKQFENNNRSVVPEAENYFKVKEMLNREPLPLNSEYKNKVKEYFNKRDD